MEEASVREKQIDEFCTITGAPRSVAESLLAVCNNSLEMAINMHMEGVEVENDKATAGPSNPEINSSNVDSGNDDGDNVREPIPPKRETLIQPDYDGFSLRSSSNLHRGRIRSVFDGFRNFSNEAKSYELDGNGFETKKGKKRTLEELFKPPIDIMYKGNWQKVRDAASLAKKWLLVNIQDAGEFSCQVLNRDIWSAEAVRTILGEHFVFWQQYKESDEANRYMTFYPVTEWPHVAIMDPRTGERLVTWSQIPDASTFCELITDFLSLHPTLDGKNSELSQESAKKRIKSSDESVSMVDASEDDQLAAAIQASLVESTSKGRINDSDSADCDTFFTDDDSNLSDVLNVDGTNGGSWKNFLGDPSDEKSSINIRFPDGTKEIKDIPCSSQLQAIVRYVIQQGFPLDKFEIVTNFPRRILSDLDQNKSLKDLGLFPRETIFVQQKN